MTINAGARQKVNWLRNRLAEGINPFQPRQEQHSQEGTGTHCDTDEDEEANVVSVKNTFLKTV